MNASQKPVVLPILLMVSGLFLGDGLGRCFPEYYSIVNWIVFGTAFCLCMKLAKTVPDVRPIVALIVANGIVYVLLFRNPSFTSFMNTQSHLVHVAVVLASTIFTSLITIVVMKFFWKKKSKVPGTESAE